MKKLITIIAMLDEKKEEEEFLREEIEFLGYQTEILDIRIRDKLKESPTLTRQEAINNTVNEKIQRVRDLHSSGRLSGIVGIGGVTGTLMGTSIMRSLPFGVPKLAVSSAAAVRAFSSREMFFHGLQGAFVEWLKVQRMSPYLHQQKTQDLELH